ncbi:MAG: acetyltransferase [Lachnospiraceae bacterium]|nr:acetyltransferase [Lachnospiraceae bacterium]
MEDIIIIGAGGFGREVAWIIERINQIEKKWNLLGFLDDSPSVCEDSLNGYRLLGGTEEAVHYPEARFVCAIASPLIRKKVVELLKKILPDCRFATIVDPSVIKSDRIRIGEGAVICAAVIMTVNISVGEHVIINLDCTVGHDAVLEDYVTLSPSVNISGGTQIGTCSEIGTGAFVLQYKNVGSCTKIGAGAVIVNDIPDCCVAVGVPAKLLPDRR